MIDDIGEAPSSIGQTSLSWMTIAYGLTTVARERRRARAPSLCADIGC